MKIETEYTNDKSKIKPARLTNSISKIWTKLIERMKYKLTSCTQYSSVLSTPLDGVYRVCDTSVYVKK